MSRLSRIRLYRGGDVVCPVLSDPTSSQVDDTTASGTVVVASTSAYKEGGTLYHYTTENSFETRADILTSGTSETVTADGVQTVLPSGLTASTTYYIHYAYVDSVGTKSNIVVSASFTTTGGGGDHNLLATDVESDSEVTAPVVGQEQALLATDIESDSEVSAPVAGQEHALLATDVESASEVTAPTAAEGHVLLSTSIESGSEVTAPVVGQEQALLSTSIESDSEVSAPVVGQEHTLLATDIESDSEVTAPTVAEGENVLLATDIESDSEVSAPAVGQEHTLLATSIESASEVSAPTVDGFVVPGGVWNAAEYFPTGQNDVVITLYDPEATADGTVSLISSACVEFGSSGLYFWDISKITTLPTPRKQYGYIMTDGSTSQGGTIEYDDFLIQYIIHNEYGL